MILTQERLRELFDYQDGNLVRKTSPAPNAQIGDIAGCLSGGYLRTRVDGEQYLNHRLIWVWRHGYFPENELDHRDRVTINNRIGNLREVSHICNVRNTGNSCVNTSGIKGVYWNKYRRKWRAKIIIEGKEYHLGVFYDFTEAVAHRLAAEQAENWEGCDSSSPAFLYMYEYINA